MGDSKAERSPQVVVMRDLHDLLRKAAFASGVPIYKIVDAVLRPVVTDIPEFQKLVARLKTRK